MNAEHDVPYRQCPGFHVSRNIVLIEEWGEHHCTNEAHYRELYATMREVR